MCEIAPPKLVGTSLGFLNTAMDIGQTIGLMISGIILTTAFAYTGLFTLLALILTTSAIIFTFSSINKEKTKNPAIT
jgi:predicted MFS family arabinose efflux permease